MTSARPCGGLMRLTIGEQVADVVGVAYSRDFAVGIQALNVKTFAGAPYEFTNSNDISASTARPGPLTPKIGGRVSAAPGWR